MKQIRDVLEGYYEDLELRRSCIPLFISNPGIGKTAIVRQFAKEKNVKCFSVIASTKMPHEFSGVSIPDKDTKLMTYYDYDELVNLNDGDILFLDEMLNANPMILNAFLTVLEDRVLPSGTKLNDILIVAAANPQGSVMLTPQIKERFIWYPIDYDFDSYFEYMKKYQIPSSIMNSINTLIKNEQFATNSNNYFTPRSVEKAIKVMIRSIPTEYEKKLGPILNQGVKNTTGKSIIVGDKTFEPDEVMPWLEIKQILHKEEKKKLQSVPVEEVETLDPKATTAKTARTTKSTKAKKEPVKSDIEALLSEDEVETGKKKREQKKKDKEKPEGEAEANSF